MRVALLSDAHLGGPDDPNQARLLAFLDRLEVDHLCLLGDIFQHWWHFGRAPFAAYAPVVDALRRFPLTFVPGNHDFHAAAFLRDELGATVGGALTPTWEGCRAHLSHGDAVDDSAGYRLACAVLRGRPFAALVDTLGPERAWRFLGRVAGRPGGSPDPVLCARQLAAADRLLGEGADLVVVGHTHAPGLHARPRGTFVNLGDWVRWHTWLLVEGGVPTLYQRRDDGTDEVFVGPPTAPPA